LTFGRGCDRLLFMKRAIFWVVAVAMLIGLGCRDKPVPPEPTEIPIPAELAENPVEKTAPPGSLTHHVQRKTLSVARRPFGITLAADGKRAYVAAALLGEISVLDTGDLEVIERWGPFGEHLFQIIPANVGNRLFAFGLSGQHLFVVDTVTGRLEKKLFLGRNLSDVVPGPNETLLVGSTADKKVTVIDQTTLDPIHEIQFSHPIGYIAVGNGGKIACATGGVYAYTGGKSTALSGPISFFDPSGKGEPQRAAALQVGTHTRKPVFVENDSFLLVPDRLDGTVRVFDVAEQRLLDVIDVGAGPEKILVHPNRKEAYTIDTQGRSATVLGWFPFSMIRQIPLPADPEDGYIGPDGKRLYLTLPALSDEGSRIAVIDLEEMRLLDLIPAGTDPCRMAVSHDGRSLFVTNFLDNSVSVFR
jgi:DNA-binding beta-propeller fold protein YncE